MAFFAPLFKIGSTRSKREFRTFKKMGYKTLAFFSAELRGIQRNLTELSESQWNLGFRRNSAELSGTRQDSAELGGTLWNATELQRCYNDDDFDYDVDFCFNVDCDFQHIVGWPAFCCYSCCSHQGFTYYLCLPSTLFRCKSALLY